MSSGMLYQPKLSKKHMPFLNGISSFKGTSYKNLLDTATHSIISFCFKLASTYITSGDTLFFTNV